MLQLGEDAALPQEAVDLFPAGPDGGRDGLHGDREAVPFARGAVHHAHSAAAQLALEPVSGDGGRRRLVVAGRIARDGLNRQIEGFYFVRRRSDDADLEYGVARGDLVAVRDLGRLDAGPVQQDSVAAVQVDHPAAGRIHLDQEVPAGKVGVVVGELEVGVLGPADEERVVPVEHELPALMRSRDDGQLELHDRVPQAMDRKWAFRR